MFKLLNPSDQSDLDYLAQMHNLRYRVFYQTHHWRDGLKPHSQMEFDDYDHENCRYLVRINQHDRVDACTRLTPTCFSYLLGGVFKHFIEKGDAPTTAKAIETSRLCADSATAPRNITGLLMAAMLELGLKSGAENYVSLSDVRIRGIVTKYGWAFEELGPEKMTSTEMSIALKYQVTREYLNNVRKIVGVDRDLLDDTTPIHNFPGVEKSVATVLATSTIH